IRGLPAQLRPIPSLAAQKPRIAGSHDDAPALRGHLALAEPGLGDGLLRGLQREVDDGVAMVLGARVVVRRPDLALDLSRDTGAEPFHRDLGHLADGHAPSADAVPE